MIPIGHILELTRYPVKSMAGVSTQSAHLGWHGLDGDRRFGFRRIGDDSGFPWLSASKLPALIQYEPFGLEESGGEPLPTHVRTPGGRVVALRSAELQREIAESSGLNVELMKLKHGIFDDAPVSVIASATIAGIGREVGEELDRRRFRANIVLETVDRETFLEDGWIGGTLLFGDDDRAPAVRVTARDVRCMMINLDPDTAVQDARVMKAVVRMNGNNAGVYGTVVQTGTIHAGCAVSLIPDSRR
jgi:uncharacterized protein